MCFTNDLSGKIVTTMGSHAKNQKQKNEKGKKKASETYEYLLFKLHFFFFFLSRQSRNFNLR